VMTIDINVLFCCLGAVSRRRTRHRFSGAEIEVLEREFCSGLRYPLVGDRLRIAAQLSLTERKVYVWFQNRRAVEKRKAREGNC
jgi:hypothetical protein